MSVGAGADHVRPRSVDSLRFRCAAAICTDQHHQPPIAQFDEVILRPTGGRTRISADFSHVRPLSLLISTPLTALLNDPSVNGDADGIGHCVIALKWKKPLTPTAEVQVAYETPSRQWQ